jgi:hypothetical protein
MLEINQGYTTMHVESITKNTSITFRAYATFTVFKENERWEKDRERI